LSSSLKKQTFIPFFQFSSAVWLVIILTFPKWKNLALTIDNK